MSVRACDTVWLTFVWPGLSLFHHVESAQATPGLTRVDIRATRRHSPLSFHTRTVSPSTIERLAASSGLMMTKGLRSLLRKESRCENVELRKELAGGLMS